MPGHLASGRGHLTEEVTSMERGGKIQKQTLFCSGNMYIWRQIIPFLQTNLCQGLTGIKFNFLTSIFLSQEHLEDLCGLLEDTNNIWKLLFFWMFNAQRNTRRGTCVFALKPRAARMSHTKIGPKVYDTRSVKCIFKCFAMVVHILQTVVQCSNAFVSETWSRPKKEWAESITADLKI